MNAVAAAATATMMRNTCSLLVANANDVRPTTMNVIPSMMYAFQSATADAQIRSRASTEKGMYSVYGNQSNCRFMSVSPPNNRTIAERKYPMIVEPKSDLSVENMSVPYRFGI